MGKKLTLNDIKDKLLKLNSNIEILSDAYISSGSKLECKCNVCNNVWWVNWDNLKQGKGCPKCAGNTKYTLKEAQQEFTQRGYIPLFNKYNNNKEKLQAKTKEGYKFTFKLTDIKQNIMPTLFGKNNPFTIDNIKLWLENNNSKYKLLSKKYIDNRDKLLLSCPIHGEFMTSWDKLYQGHGCSKCANNIKYTLNEVKTKLHIINTDIDILSNEYINNNHKLSCKCKECGHEWEVTWNGLSRGRGCPECAKIRVGEIQSVIMRGKYIGEKHWNWKGGITPLANHIRLIIYQWRNDSFKKYNYRCDITGLHENIIIHHMNKNFRSILRETMSILDLPIHKEISSYTSTELQKIGEKCIELHYKYGLGVCLTDEIHREFHKIYGKENNTFEQYIEFKKNQLHNQELVQAS